MENWVQNLNLVPQCWFSAELLVCTIAIDIGIIVTDDIFSVTQKSLMASVVVIPYPQLCCSLGVSGYGNLEFPFTIGPSSLAKFQDNI